jgi:LL-diaminopimelate aminotransferase
VCCISHIPSVVTANIAIFACRMPVKCPRNENFAKLGAGYLFPVVAAKRREYAAKHPDAKIISLGIGDTTHPLPPAIASAMASYSSGLGTKEAYEGYDPKSESPLKAKIAEVMYPGLGISADEVFVSDGSKCDLGRLQVRAGLRGHHTIFLS